MTNEDATPKTETDTGDKEPDTLKPTETVDFWKSKAREQEKRAKANADAATRLAEIEEAQKTETQRLNDQLAAEKAEREKVEREALRFRVAAEKGVPADLLDLLHGDNEDEMNAKADKLVALLAKDDAPRRPAPDPRQGANGGGTPSTAQQFAAAIEGSLNR